jgi:hypothetical protein
MLFVAPGAAAARCDKAKKEGYERKWVWGLKTYRFC